MLSSECQENILIFASRKEVSRSSMSSVEIIKKRGYTTHTLGVGHFLFIVCHCPFVVLHHLILNRDRQLVNATP